MEEISYVKTFSVIGIFILLLACINFMNLSTAQALKRGKEVGVRKTLGSSKKQLIFQFFTESLLIILFSFGIALLLTRLLLPGYNTLTLKEVAIPFFIIIFLDYLPSLDRCYCSFKQSVPFILPFCVQTSESIKRIE